MSFFSGLGWRIGSLKQLRSILVFVILSFVVWTFSKMSETHTAHIDIEFDFVDESFETFRIDAEKPTVRFVVSGTGFRLLSARFLKPTISLSLSDVQLDEEGFYFTQADLISATESHFRNVFRVNQLTLKRLNAPFIQPSIKKIPIRLDQDLMVAKGYAWSTELQTTPDSLYVYGIPSEVDTLTHARLESPMDKVFDTSLDQNLRITADLRSNFKWSQTVVHARQELSRYTEVDLRLPVEMIDSTNKFEISLLPAFVEVNLLVPLDKVRQIDPSQFVLGCRLSSDTIVEYLDVHFETIPAGVIVKDITPKQVRYFLN